MKSTREIREDIHIRVSPQLFKAIKQAADKEGRTVSNYIKMYIAQKLGVKL